jgi:hypothetical protein
LPPSQQSGSAPRRPRSSPRRPTRPLPPARRLRTSAEVKFCLSYVM